MSAKVEVLQSSTYRKWFGALRDAQVRARILARISRLSMGNPGVVRQVGKGHGVSVSELKIDYGPGYRVYFTQRGAQVVILLCGGDKRTQAADILRAVSMARDFKE